MHPVCILTAGRGTRMGPYAEIINKALLPYEGKAILSHIIDGFPKGTPFVIALGHRGDQVRDYLTAAHPDDNITYSIVDNYDQPGSGPGYSIWCCREHLQKPFYFVAADTVAKFDATQMTDTNWAGVSSVPAEESKRFCNFTVDADRFIDKIYDKQIPPNLDPVPAFVGLMFIKDCQLFWDALAKPETVAGEVQVSAGLKALVAAGNLRAREVGWKDFGVYDDYKRIAIDILPYDFSKTDEFIYNYRGRIIKFFADGKIAQRRVEKAKLRPEIFPAPEMVGENFYYYPKVPGDTVYNQLTPSLFEQMIEWLDADVWHIPKKLDADAFAVGCREFYEKKTMARLKKFQEKYSDFSEPKTINGAAVEPVTALLSKIDFEKIAIGLPRFIHGDLQFDNVIYDGKKFTLIDWRQEFAGRTEYGDWYYDLAKLLGGIYLNYDYIKLNLMQVSHQGDVFEYDYARRANTFAYQEILHDYVLRNGLEWRRVQLITGLIYLNMAPLHVAPFDVLLYGLAQQLLTEVLA